MRSFKSVAEAMKILGSNNFVHCEAMPGTWFHRDGRRARLVHHDWMGKRGMWVIEVTR